MGFPGGAVVENLPANAGDTGWIPGRGTKIPHTTQPKKKKKLISQNTGGQNLHCSVVHLDSSLGYTGICIRQNSPKIAYDLTIFILKEKPVNRHWTLILYAEVFRGECTDICNLLWNTSKNKMDSWKDRGMNEWIDTW